MKKIITIFAITFALISSAFPAMANVIYQTASGVNLISPYQDSCSYALSGFSNSTANVKSISLQIENQYFGQQGYNNTANVWVQIQSQDDQGNHNGIFNSDSVDISTNSATQNTVFTFATAFANQGTSNGTFNSDGTFAIKHIASFLIYGDSNGRNWGKFDASPTADSHIAQCSGLVPVMTFNDASVPVVLAITAPANGSNVEAAANFVITGTCPNVGANKLAFAPDVTGQNFTPTYNIECKSDHTFSFTHNVDQYLTHFYVIDSTDGSFVLSNYTVDNPQNNQITFVYPEGNATNYYSLQASNNFPMRFGYKLDSNLKSQAQNVHVFVKQCLDQTYNNCSTPIGDGNLLSLDNKPNYLFDVNVPVVLNTIRYYEISLRDEATGNNTYAKLDFTVIGTNNLSDPAPVIPSGAGGTCTNFLCDLFIPSHDFWSNFFPATVTLLQTKVPFAYFYALTGSYTSGLPIGSQNQDIANYTVGIHTSSVNFSQSMNFFDFSNPDLQNAITPFRTVMSYLLWAGFGWWLLTRSFKIFHA